MMQEPGVDASIQGTLLGTFAVQGTLVSSTCGPSAFGATDRWDFDVKLSRDGSKLYWYTGEDRVEGQIAADGQTFAFSTTVTGKVSDAAKGKKGCTLTRADALTGKLAGTGEDIGGFSGNMSYQFGQTADSDCSEAAASEGVLALPCAMSYSLNAARR